MLSVLKRMAKHTLLVLVFINKLSPISTSFQSGSPLEGTEDGVKVKGMQMHPFFTLNINVQKDI